ncbi:MAG TPA: 3-carboxymuconate cyclase, partial [Xanthomonadaceae bacterium]|nr:3-carboxymuconate cyclase [Xanthomonadaceae bacterium]
MPRLLLWLLCSLPAAACAAPLDLLVGSYTAPDAPGIHGFRFDPARGRLERTPWQSVRLDNPSWLVVSPDQRQVYAINENGPGQPDPVGRVSRLEMDAQHRLSLRERVSTLSDHPTHGSLSPDGRYLFVANYSGGADPGGLLAVLPLDAGGRLQPVTQVAAYQASGVDPERQASSHVHAAVVAPDGRHVLATDLGGDRVHVYAYDPAASAERPLRPAASVPLPAGSGPRHLVFDRSGRHAYLTLEMSGQLAWLDYAGGTLELRGVVDLFAPGFAGGNGAGALHFSPDGRWLYVVNRGDDNHLAAFAIDADSGAPTR